MGFRRRNVLKTIALSLLFFFYFFIWCWDSADSRPIGSKYVFKSQDWMHLFRLRFSNLALINRLYNLCIDTIDKETNPFSFDVSTGKIQFLCIHTSHFSARIPFDLSIQNQFKILIHVIPNDLGLRVFLFLHLSRQVQTI